MEKNKVGHPKGIPSPRKGVKLSLEERVIVSMRTKEGMVSEEVRNKLRGKNNAMANPATREKMIKTIREQRKIPENCSNWQGGKTSVTRKLRNCVQMQEWKKCIFLRDNYTCQLCYKRGSQVLEAHHKISFNVILDLYEIRDFNSALSCKLLWDTNWGITLCKKCHNKLPRR